MKMKIFQIDLECQTQQDFRQTVTEYLSGQEKRRIAKVNTEFLMRAKNALEFLKTLSGFDQKIADGTGVLWAARFLTLKTTDIPVIRGLQILWQAKYSLLSLIFYPRFCRYPIPERIPGVEALYLMLEAAIETDSSVYFLGAEEGVNKRAVEVIQKKYPKLKIAGSYGGYRPLNSNNSWKDEKTVTEINRSGAALLIVALGSPKQEYWIRDNMDGLQTVKIAVGEGGSLDFIAGVFKRAPRWMQRIGLEWFWRLFANRSKSTTGSRAKRVWQAVPVFICEIIKYKLKFGAVETDDKKN